jgi:hypothetical protein
MDDARAAIWDAINEYAAACGGDTSDATISPHRMNAVAAVEGGLRRLESHEEGMAIRDYFAGQALAGILANPSWNQIGLAAAGVSDQSCFKVATLIAVQYADAMIAARK